MTKNEATIELLKAAVMNPNFNPVYEQSWEDLFELAPSIKENISDLLSPKDGKGTRIIS